MKDHLISMYIDNEMNLNEKIDFIEHIHSRQSFKNEAIELLNQEKLIRSDVVDLVPPVLVSKKKRIRFSMLEALGFFSSGLAVALLLILFLQPSNKQQDIQQKSLLIPYRFVVYRPDVSQAEIVGNFNAWQAIPMIKTDGYWQITLQLSPGEYRYSYILDGSRRVSDPTIPIREHDDFGGENSILEVKDSV